MGLSQKTPCTALKAAFHCCRCLQQSLLELISSANTAKVNRPGVSHTRMCCRCGPAPAFQVSTLASGCEHNTVWVIRDKTFVTHTKIIQIPFYFGGFRMCAGWLWLSIYDVQIELLSWSSPAAIINTPVCFFSPVGHCVCNPLICKFTASCWSSWSTQCLDLNYIRILMARFALVTFDEWYCWALVPSCCYSAHLY